MCMFLLSRRYPAQIYIELHFAALLDVLNLGLNICVDIHNNIS